MKIFDILQSFLVECNLLYFTHCKVYNKIKGALWIILDF